MKAGAAPHLMRCPCSSTSGVRRQQTPSSGQALPASLFGNALGDFADELTAALERAGELALARKVAGLQSSTMIAPPTPLRSTPSRGPPTLTAPITASSNSASVVAWRYSTWSATESPASKCSGAATSAPVCVSSASSDRCACRLTLRCCWQAELGRYAATAAPCHSSRKK